MSFDNLTVEHLDDELTSLMWKLYPTQRLGFVKVGQKKWFMPYRYVENGNKIYNIKTRPDDIWIVTYPRSGTTMIQELVWLVANDMNFNEARRRNLFERFPFIELGLLESEILTYRPLIEQHSFEYVQILSSPRFIKTHMPLDLLPTVVNSDCKIIYVARNPRDVAFSCYHFQKDIKYLQYQGTFEQFCNNFLNDHTIWSPYWEHVKEAWTMRNRTNMLFLFYEDLKKDLSESIKKVATFLNKTYNDEQIIKLVEYLNIKNFRKNLMIYRTSVYDIKPEEFIRQRKRIHSAKKDWKEVCTPVRNEIQERRDQIEERFGKWIADNLKNTDLVFPI